MLEKQDLLQDSLMMKAYPSIWLIGPTILSLILFSYSYQDFLFMPACLLAIVGALIFKLSIAKKLLLKSRNAAILAVIVVTLCSIYYGIFLIQKGSAINIIVGLASGIVLAGLWYLSIKRTIRESLIFSCTIIIVISSANIDKLPSSLFQIIMLSYFLITLLALANNGGGIRSINSSASKFIIWRIGITLIALIAIGLATFSIRYGIGVFEKNLFKNFANGELFKLANFIDGVGVAGDMNITRNSELNLTAEVVAAIDGKLEDKYLRTQVLTKYQDGRWITDASPQDKLTRISKHFELLSKDLLIADEMNITLYENLRGAVPLPAMAGSISTNDEVSFVSIDGTTLQSYPSQNLNSYLVKNIAKDELSSIKFVQDPAALSAPEKVLLALRPLAQSITQNKEQNKEIDSLRADKKPLETAKKIESYFQDNYQYSLKVALNSDQDPIVDFVLNRRPAYCKYYASGMVLMLRSLGIPARIVSGFLAKEYNPIAKTWIVRGRDAHVWCEVYDLNKQQWIRFDPTPAAVITPQIDTGLLNLLAQQWEWIKLTVKSYLTNFELSNLFDLARLQNWLAKNINFTLIIGLTILIVTIVITKFRARVLSLFKRLFARKDKIECEQNLERPANIVVRKELLKITELLAQQGLPMMETETSTEYLQRLKIAMIENKFTLLNSNKDLADLEEFFRIYQEIRFSTMAIDENLNTTFNQTTERLINRFTRFDS